MRHVVFSGFHILRPNAQIQYLAKICLYFKILQTVCIYTLPCARQYQISLSTASQLTVDLFKKKKKKIFYILVFTQVAVVTQKRNIASGWRKAVKVMPPSEKGCMSRLPWGRKDRNTSRETEVMQATSLGMIHYSGSLHCRNWLCIKMLDDNFC